MLHARFLRSSLWPERRVSGNARRQTATAGGKKKQKTCHPSFSPIQNLGIPDAKTHRKSHISVCRLGMNDIVG